jgi:hypothetical protein
LDIDISIFYNDKIEAQRREKEWNQCFIVDKYGIPLMFNTIFTRVYKNCARV